MFERVASLEQEEFHLEKKIRHLDMQLEQVGEDEDDEEEEPVTVANGKADKKSKNSNPDKASKKEKAVNSTTPSQVSTSGDGDGEPLMSQSILGKFEENVQQKSKIRRVSGIRTERRCQRCNSTTLRAKLFELSTHTRTVSLP